MGLTYTYRSDDTGAPSLTGQVGSMITVLDAILVNGYNSKTVTITRSGTTATANCTSHGMRAGAIINISGANESDYNGDFRIAVVDANNFTFTVANSPATPATGTITAKFAPLGWTKAYSGTNKAAYRQPTTGANGFYLRVDDNTNAQNALVRGYETMTDVDTGTNPFPTTAQIGITSGLYWYKSSSANSTARSWQFYGYKRGFYFTPHQQAANATTFGQQNGALYWFGDITGYKSGDLYHTQVLGEASSGYNGNSSSGHSLSVWGMWNTLGGHYMARNSAGSVGAINNCKAGNAAFYRSTSNQNIGGTGATYPDPILGGVQMSRVWVCEGNGARGHFPGLWDAHVNGAWTSEDTFTGAVGSNLAGRSFAINLGVWSAYVPLVFETSDTWD